LKKLMAMGFSEKTAAKLQREHSRETIEEQMQWLPFRTPARSPAGLLRRAIEQHWSQPAKLGTSQVMGTMGWAFARHFYAAFGGNSEEPVNEPSSREAEMAEAFVKRLLKVWPDESHVEEWGRGLGRMAREQRNSIPSLSLAIRQFGDAFLVTNEKARLHAQLERTASARASHEESYRPAWQAWLKSQEAEMRATHPAEYGRFLAKRERERSELRQNRASWAPSMLARFDTEGTRLHTFQQFFGLPDFWVWDAEINSHRFNFSPSQS
jgi:hypothetical protein